MFVDRSDAGRRLTEPLVKRRLDAPVVVIALPAGGVPVAAEVAAALDAPLDALVSCKIGPPLEPEVAIGAVAEGGARVLDPGEIAFLGLREHQLAQMVLAAEAEVERRVARYRRGRPLHELAGHTVILVDDGVVTGSTMRAAIAAARAGEAERIVVAAPVISADAARKLATEVDDVVWLISPEEMDAIAAWYVDFEKVTDDEVVDLLRSPAARVHDAECAHPTQ